MITMYSTYSFLSSAVVSTERYHEYKVKQWSLKDNIQK